MQFGQGNVEIVNELAFTGSTQQVIVKWSWRCELEASRHDPVEVQLMIKLIVSTMLQSVKSVTVMPIYL